MENKLKDFKGGILCYVSKNQVAQAYLDYMQHTSYRGGKHDQPCPQQDIAITNTIIEGLSDNGLISLWNVLHGFKNETFVKVGQKFMRKSINFTWLIDVEEVNETEGTAIVEIYALNQGDVVRMANKEFKVGKIATFTPISEDYYFSILEEWQGNDDGKLPEQIEQDQL